MGINFGNLLLLTAYADSERKKGASNLGELLMFGRLINTLSNSQQRGMARHHGIPADRLADTHVEPLLRYLGADSVASLDISDYEGCDIVFDLMQDAATDPEIAARFIGKYDTILDFGTSEHVFNAPQALVNAWNFLRDGGRYIFDLPVTGWTSHCLYQFTPNYFISVGQSDYFILDHLFFHGKRDRRVRAIRNFNKTASRWLNRRRRTSAWGVLRKTRPEGMAGTLTLSGLRVMQTDVRRVNIDADGASSADRSGSNRRYTVSTIAAAFDNRG